MTIVIIASTTSLFISIWFWKETLSEQIYSLLLPEKCRFLTLWGLRFTPYVAYRYQKAQQPRKAPSGFHMPMRAIIEGSNGQHEEAYATQAPQLWLAGQRIDLLVMDQLVLSISQALHLIPLCYKFTHKSKCSTTNYTANMLKTVCKHQAHLIKRLLVLSFALILPTIDPKLHYPVSFQRRGNITIEIKKEQNFIHKEWKIRPKKKKTHKWIAQPREREESKRVKNRDKERVKR